MQQLNLIIKGDVSGSVEALEDALVNIDLGEANDEVSLRVIGRGVGAITENDINLAIASDAVVIGFNVRPEGKAREAAEREGVDVRYYTVIYQAIDEIEAALKGMLKPEFEEVQLGTAEVREVFRVPRIGNIAGSLVRTGTIRRNSKARLVRDGVVVADNLTVESLRRFKDDATEVRDGFECGIGLGSFNDIKIDDVIETFELREKPRRTARSPTVSNGRTAMVVRHAGRLSDSAARGDVRSLKDKRAVVRPIVAELRRRFEVAAAETGALDLHRRAEVSVAALASTHAHVVEVLDSCERFVAGRPEVELLAVRRRLLDDDDLT